MAVPHPKSPFATATAFDGLVTEVLALGARSVRLANGHLVTALPSKSKGAESSWPGDKVTVEMAFRELNGWRLVHPGRVVAAELAA
jgi:translation initiation factor IF-1